MRLSLFSTVIPNPPPVRAGFVPILARRRHLWGVGGPQCAEFSLYTYHIPLIVERSRHD